MGLERRARSLSAGGPQCAGGRKGRTLAARLSYVSGRLRHGFRAWLDGAASSAGPAGSVRTRRRAGLSPGPDLSVAAWLYIRRYAYVDIWRYARVEFYAPSGDRKSTRLNSSH